MTNEKWNVLLVREGAEAMRQFSLPPKTVRRGIVAVCTFLVFLAGATAFLVYDSGARARAAHLARENRLLKDEMERIRSSVADLDGRVATLAENDRRVRVVAGLLEIDEEVFEVGVGGPGLESPDENELWSLDPEVSEAAYAMRYDLAVLLRKADLLESSFAESEENLVTRRERLRFIPSILPVRGPIASEFSVSRLHPVYKVHMAHEGIDQNASTGAPFVATAEGVVTFAGWKPGFGNTIEIDHGSGITTLYAHASTLLVRAGERIRREQVIGQVGCTGACTGPHVHYEVHVNGRPVNPRNYVLRSTSP